MALTEGDKAQCMEIARVIVKEVLDEHINSCPHGQTISLLKARFIGICIGIGVASSGVAATIMQLLK